mmetsp:Transcript_2249/g.4641  ORF Transcript_2249/g.4641 Transcript_2249/m.4641 type:complete len:106 (-) Transcript_2249:438-755(-)
MRREVIVDISSKSRTIQYRCKTTHQNIAKSTPEIRETLCLLSMIVQDADRNLGIEAQIVQSLAMRHQQRYKTILQFRSLQELAVRSSAGLYRFSQLPGPVGALKS